MGVFDKWTKKATVNAIETTKETLNDKLETYSGIIKAGLTLVVIAFGSKKVHEHMKNKDCVQAPMPFPQPYQTYPQPIVINNYFDRGYENGKPRQNRQQYQKRR